MTTDATPPPRRRGRTVRGLAMLGVSLVGLTTVATGAFFSDSTDVGGNTFSTGSVTLGVDPATAAITMTGMAPGDVVTAPITVSNTGTLGQRYSVLSTTDALDADLLAAQLQMTVKTGVTTCTTAGFGSSGTAVYGPGVLGSTTGTEVLGDAAAGGQAGDRALAAGADEVLCVQVALPGSTGNAYQGKTTTATLRFDAEQTVNNP